jgi:hypothetical protein
MAKKFVEKEKEDEVKMVKIFRTPNENATYKFSAGVHKFVFDLNKTEFMIPLTSLQKVLKHCNFVRNKPKPQMTKPVAKKESDK